MKVYLVQRLSLLGLIACCLQMGSVNAAIVSRTEAFDKRLERKENKELIKDIFIALILRSVDNSPEQGHDITLSFLTERLIKDIFPDIKPEALQKAAGMRDLLISFDEYKFQQFSGNMQLAFIAIVNKLAKLAKSEIKNELRPAAKAKMKQLEQLGKKLKNMPIVEPVE